MKNALLLTGAAARISQEVAIIDQLIEQKGLHISEQDTMLAGFSSGALNSIAINACFRSENPLSWDTFFKQRFLFNIKTEDVFLRKRFIPYNTNPLRNLVESFMKEANYEKLGDLSFQSYILAFSYLRFKTIWANSNLNRHAYANLVDLLMATTAIPIVFPDSNIGKIEKKRCSIAQRGYIDGGAGGSFKRFKPQLGKFLNKNGTLENLYIISPMREISTADFDEFNELLPTKDLLKLDLKEFKLIKSFLLMISMNGFEKFIHEFNDWNNELINPLAKNIYVSIPKLSENFPILNFNKQEEQYNAVKNWATSKPEELAIPIGDYVKLLKS